MFSKISFLFQRAEGDFVDLSQRGEKSHFSDPQSIATCKDPVTILLLGTADSGKSTVVKQMKVLKFNILQIISVSSKMLNHGLNHGLFLSLFKLTPCPIHWIVYVLACLYFIFEF